MILVKKSVLRFCLPFLLLVFSLAGVASAKPANHYSHTNSKGRTYFLFKKDVALKNSEKIQTIYFFAKDPNNKKGTPLAAVPEDRMVHETKRGLLVLKKKESTKPKKKE